MATRIVGKRLLKLLWKQTSGESTYRSLRRAFRHQCMPGGVRATTAMHTGISFISGHLLVVGIVWRSLGDIEVTSWLVSADDFSSRVARGANERVSAANEWVQRLLATSEEKSDKRTNHEVICLFYTYWDFKRILRKKIVMKNKFISNRVIKLHDGMTKSIKCIFFDNYI